MCEGDQRMGALGRGQAFEVCGPELGDELVRVDARSRDRPYIFYESRASFRKWPVHRSRPSPDTVRIGAFTCRETPSSASTPAVRAG
jgi:hypothetical protein